MTVENGKLVSIEYTIHNSKKELVETNVGDEPLEYIHGSDQIIPGLEKALEGMKVGETKKVTIPPEEAYGEIDDEAYEEVPREFVPEDAQQVGEYLQTTDDDGEILNAIVAEVNEENIIIDFNHPLAGETLDFDIKVLEVQDPEEEEE